MFPFFLSNRFLCCNKIDCFLIFSGWPKNGSFERTWPSSSTTCRWNDFLGSYQNRSLTIFNGLTSTRVSQGIQGIFFFKPYSPDALLRYSLRSYWIGHVPSFKWLDLELNVRGSDHITEWPLNRSAPIMLNSIPLSISWKAFLCAKRSEATDKKIEVYISTNQTSTLFGPNSNSWYFKSFFLKVRFKGH